MPAQNHRPYRERFLDNYDRSQLRREVQAVRPKKRLTGFRKKAASWALGASLAVGGIGIAPRMMQSHHGTAASGEESQAPDITPDAVPIDKAIAGDITAAQSIAKQVAGGVEAVAQGVEAATSAPLSAVAEAPKQLTMLTEKVREDFFHKEVPFGSIIYREAKNNNLRPELVAAVVQAESKFKPTARSGAGAVGLMQLVPKTGRWMGARDLTNPAQNIAAGAKYLKYLHDRFDGNEQKVIAAYNAGEGNVQRFNGVPPFRETRNYVKRVQNFEDEFRNRVDSHNADVAASQVAEAR